MTTSGGAYYKTAVELREQSKIARASYPEALAAAEEKTLRQERDAAALHAEALIVQAVGFELAAAIYCVAQAIEDVRR